MTTNPAATLHKLSEPGETTDGSSNDIRGREVADMDGNLIGKIVGLYIDDGERKIRFLVVKNGGFLGLGGTKSLIPVEAIDRVTSTWSISPTPVSTSPPPPAYNSELVSDERAFYSRVYDYYGYAPLGV